MQNFSFPSKKNIAILALGAESAGNFSVYSKGKIFFSDAFSDLLEEANWKKYQKEILKYLRINKIKPQIILTDLHPIYRTTLWGGALAKKYGAKHISVQHHHAHIFSAIGDSLLETPSVLKFRHRVSKAFYGIAMDGTGYGTDGKIWGGEAFSISNFQFPISNKKERLEIKRIGHLENQILIGGDLAIREPARMLISILNKFLSKKEIYDLTKKHYNKNQFELIYNQLQQKFNCLETSSTGRVLDAISILLGFCGNKRNYKHEPIHLLEKNSTKPYANLKPKIKKHCRRHRMSTMDIRCPDYTLDTTYLFKYVLKYLHCRDKNLSAEEAGRLAATAQFYIAQGLYEIIKLNCHPERSLYSDEVEGSTKKYHQQCHKADSSTTLRYAQNDIFISGGLANNKIISEYFISKGAYGAKKIPRGDAGLSFGQIVYCLLS